MNILISLHKTKTAHYNLEDIPEEKREELIKLINKRLDNKPVEISAVDLEEELIRNKCLDWDDECEYLTMDVELD